MAGDRLTPALQALFGLPEVVPAGRAALGIAVALQAWAGGRDVGVAVPAAVCQDVIAAILLAGCTPHFCDVDPATGLTPGPEWRRARAAGCRAAIVVHLYGNPADTAAARAAFPAGDCLLIDDAAQALGARTATGLAGSEGDVGVLSFGHTKHIEVGGAALLLRDRGLAAECGRRLQAVSAAPDAASGVEAAFRAGLQNARRRWIERGATAGFAGLLTGYAPALQAVWNPAWAAPIAAALAGHPARLAERRAKAAAWRASIQETALRPVGMPVDAAATRSAPWRFACRLPGCTPAEQHRIGETLRAAGLQVSHWYLPAHWLLGQPAGSLPGVEQLAREAFQFWLDEATPRHVAEQAGPLLQACFAASDEAVR